MKGTKSIRNFVFAVTGTVLIILVVLYSYVSLTMLDRGSLAPVVWMMDHEAKQYQAKYASDPLTPLPNSDFITSSLDIAQFPPEHRALFSQREAGVAYQQMEEGELQYIVGVIPLHDGGILYLLFEDTEDIPDEVWQFVEDIAEPLIPVFLLSVLFAMVVVSFMTYRFLRPIKKLEHWATHITLDNINEPVPSFTFKELDAVAIPLQAALQRIDRMLSKEQFLIRTTSHELRTPIAVVATNMELLKRMLRDVQVTGGCSEAIQRIDRATVDMQKITETVLWLGRDPDGEIEQHWICLGELVDELITANANLIESKQVELQRKIHQARVKVAPTPCRIAISNILRNALQYTHQGVIHIVVDANRVHITNHNVGNHSFDKTGTDYGFGLGLALVERICQRLDWYYRNEETNGGRDVTIDFDRQFDER